MRDHKHWEQLEHYLQAYQLRDVFNEQVIEQMTLYKFKQGEVICSQGDPLENLFVLVKGKIKIYTTSTEGKALILSFKTPLDLVGDIEYVQGSEIMNTVEAVSSVHLIGVHRRWLERYAADSVPFLQFLLHAISQKFFMKSNSLSFNLMYPVEVRLASYLLSVSFDESDSLLKGQLSTEHLKDAANLIGTSYRHLNRVIQQFCQSGLVERTKAFITVKDMEGLRALAGHSIYE